MNEGVRTGIGDEDGDEDECWGGGRICEFDGEGEDGLDVGEVGRVWGENVILGF